MGKEEKKKESVKVIKSVENININMPPLILLQNIRNQLDFFLQLSVCGGKSICAFVCLFAN